MQNPFGAAFVTQKEAGVVFQPAALDEGCEFGAKLFDLEARDVAGQAFRVRPDIPEAAGSDGLFRVRPPGGLLLALLVESARLTSPAHTPPPPSGFRQAPPFAPIRALVAPSGSRGRCGSGQRFVPLA
jgi:hypothetical protein